MCVITNKITKINFVRNKRVVNFVLVPDSSVGFYST